MEKTCGARRKACNARTVRQIAGGIALLILLWCLSNVGEKQLGELFVVSQSGSSSSKAVCINQAEWYGILLLLGK